MSASVFDVSCFLLIFKCQVYGNPIDIDSGQLSDPGFRSLLIEQIYKASRFRSSYQEPQGVFIRRAAACSYDLRATRVQTVAQYQALLGVDVVVSVVPSSFYATETAAAETPTVTTTPIVTTPVDGTIYPQSIIPSSAILPTSPVYVTSFNTSNINHTNPNINLTESIHSQLNLAPNHSDSSLDPGKTQFDVKQNQQNWQAFQKIRPTNTSQQLVLQTDANQTTEQHKGSQNINNKPMAKSKPESDSLTPKAKADLSSNQVRPQQTNENANSDELQVSESPLHTAQSANFQDEKPSPNEEPEPEPDQEPNQVTDQQPGLSEPQQEQNLPEHQNSASPQGNFWTNAIDSISSVLSSPFTKSPSSSPPQPQPQPQATPPQPDTLSQPDSKQQNQPNQSVQLSNIAENSKSNRKQQTFVHIQQPKEPNLGANQPSGPENALPKVAFLFSGGGQASQASLEERNEITYYSRSICTECKQFEK